MAGVYISYPFCNQKCSFCNFASGVFSGKAREQYEGVIASQLEGHVWEWQPETVYLGGGTPSLMAPEVLRRWMSLIPSGRLGEVTIECAPGTVDERRIAAWREAGVNRISLGVQSFIGGELAKTGRRHTAESVEHDVRMLEAAGLTNINLDLIAGMPGQTREAWAESLRWIEMLAPPHVSIYIFEIDEDSRLGKEAILGGSRYGARDLPDDDLTAELYETAVDRLQSWGIKRYEISNFAKPGFESAHNLKYWRLEPYAGFGLDAHSFDGRRRWSTSDDLRHFLEGTESPEMVTTDHGEERFFVGLRLAEGIRPAEAEWSRFAQPIEKWVERGMLVRERGTLRLTERGFLLSNEIFQEFINV